MFFEPIKNTFNRLKENVGDKAILINTALGNKEDEVEMFTETINEGQSSSVLEPDYHLVQHPSIQFDGKETVKMTKLDKFIEHKEKFNFINIDVQGYELEVLKGSTEILLNVEYILCEINRAELYKNCPMVEEIDSFLNDYGFKRDVTSWDGYTWGDALYIRQ